jgi:polyisoprenoid-binding protein YceI
MEKLSIKIMSVFFVAFLFMSSLTNAQTKLVTKTGHATFFSHTPIEDIQAHNYKVISSIDPSTGSIVFSVPMQSFEFEKSLMQKHFNQKKFLSTKKFPKAKFKGQIKDLSSVNFSEDGVYEVLVEGDLTIRGVTKSVSEKGTITIEGGKISSASTFEIVLADYGIAFEKGKPSKNIGKSVEITVEMKY